MLDVKNAIWPAIVNAETLEADKEAVWRRTTSLSFAVFATSAALCYLAPTRGRVLLGLAATALTGVIAKLHFDGKSYLSAFNARVAMVEKAFNGLQSQAMRIPDDALIVLTASKTMRDKLGEKLLIGEDWINLWLQVCQTPTLANAIEKDEYLLSEMLKQTLMNEHHDKREDCYRELFKCESDTFFSNATSHKYFEPSFAFYPVLELNDLTVELQKRRWNYFTDKNGVLNLLEMAFKTDFAILENNDGWKKFLKSEHELDNEFAGGSIRQALRQGHTQILAALLKNPNLDAIKKDELLVYDCWVEARSFEITNLLLQYKFNPNASYRRGDDALQAILANQPGSYPKDFTQEKHVLVILNAGASNLEEALIKCKNDNIRNLIMAFRESVNK